MEKNPQPGLEELIHRELSRLPPRTAPENLIPRVLAELQARAQRRWWQCPWTQWPFWIRVVSLPLLASLLVVAIGMVSRISQLAWATPDLGPLAQLGHVAGALWEVVATLGNAVVVLGRTTDPQWLWLGLSVPLSMYLACVGLGTLCYRMALSRR